MFWCHLYVCNVHNEKILSMVLHYVINVSNVRNVINVMNDIWLIINGLFYILSPLRYPFLPPRWSRPL